MNNFIKKIKISGIINIIFGSFIVLASEELSLYSTVLLVTGVLFLVLSSKSYEELIAKEKNLIILAVINLFFNIISSFLVFLAIDQIKSNNIERNNSPPKKIETPIIDKETKKIDMILKLGVLMVLVSGLLFATTSWNIISDLTKSLLLFLIGILFIGLSKFVDVKLKLKKTSNTYWLLGMFFFLFFLISLMYFKLLSPTLSFSGQGRHLCNSIILIAISVIAFLSSKKFQIKDILYVTYLGCYCAIYNFSQYFNLESNIIMSIILVIVFLTTILLHSNKEYYLYKTNKLLNYFAWVIVLLNYLDDLEYFSSFIAIILVIANLYYFFLKDKENIYNIFIPIISAVMLIFLSIAAPVNSWEFLPSLIIITGLYLLVSFSHKDSKPIKTVNELTYNISNLIAIFSLSTSSSINLEPLLISTIYLIINIISNIKYKEKINMYIQPVVILLTVSSLIAYIGNYIEQIDIYYQVILLTLTYIILHVFIKTDDAKKLYYISTLISSIFLHIITLSMNEINVLAVILIPIAYLYLYFKAPTIKKLKEISYALFIFSIYNFFVNFNIIKMLPVFAAITTIWVYVIILYFKENITEKNIILAAIILPVISIINNLGAYLELKAIVINLLLFYITYLIIKIFVKDIKTKNIISTIGYIIAMLTIIFETTTLIGIYIGLISIIAIILGYYKQEYKNLFKLGIITTIFNIIYQLRVVWGKVPFWLYLLITGLGLIAFVTYKEIIKNDDQNH